MTTPHVPQAKGGPSCNPHVHPSSCASACEITTAASALLPEAAHPTLVATMEIVGESAEAVKARIDALVREYMERKR
jgi:hypothetical protein